MHVVGLLEGVLFALYILVEYSVDKGHGSSVPIRLVCVALAFEA